MVEINPNADVTNQGASATPQISEPAQQPATQVSSQQPGESESRYQKRIDQLTAARRAAEEKARLAEERALQLEAQIRGRNVASPTQEPMVGEITASKWREWHDEDPLAANDYLLELKANQKAQQIVSGIQVQSQHANAVDEVYKAHPELKEVMEGKKLPEEVPFWGVYDEVAKEMPDARLLARGPFIVMKEAERRVKEREMAEIERQATEQGATNEANRQVRVGAAHTLSPSARPPVSVVKLTPEEERIARKMGISPEEYIANKKQK